MNIAAYCRVSTEKKDQLNSLEAQKSFFLEYTGRSGDKLVKLYADEGLSGTKIKNRKQFLQMIKDAELGLFDMVVVKDIPFYSLCEHHLLPFFGKAHVAYIPNGKITGLSKIARVVDVFARRLQVQERMTTQIKDCIQQTLNPLGVMVVIEAEHLCMQMRGVQKPHAVTTTSDFTGAFNRAETREEFMNLIRG